MCNLGEITCETFWVMLKNRPGTKIQKVHKGQHSGEEARKVK